MTSVLAVALLLMVVAGHGEAATKPAPHLRYMQPADFRDTPWLGDTEGAFIKRYGKPHRVGTVAADSWYECPNDSGVYQLFAFFEQDHHRAFIVTRNYCAAIPKAVAQLKEAKLFMPPDARRVATPPDLLPAVFYRSDYLGSELHKPEWIWGGAPGTYQVETDDQGGQWTLSLGQ